MRVLVVLRERNTKRVKESSWRHREALSRWCPRTTRPRSSAAAFLDSRALCSSRHVNHSAVQHQELHERIWHWRRLHFQEAPASHPAFISARRHFKVMGGPGLSDRNNVNLVHVHLARKGGARRLCCDEKDVDAAARHLPWRPGHQRDASFEKLSTLLLLEVVKVKNEHIAIDKHTNAVGLGPRFLIERTGSRPCSTFVGLT